jgi:hypothetical protein
VRRAVASLVAGTTIAVATATALAAGPTGDPAAIALFRRAVAVTNALPAYVQTQSGYVRIQDSLGPRKFAHWAWGWDQFKPGYHPATERIVIDQRHGRTVWIEDTLTAAPKGCGAPSCRQAAPIEFVITPTHAYYGLISSGSSPPCFNPWPRRHVPYAAGSPWWTTAGSFAAPVPDGALTELRSKLSIDGRVVTEHDWVSRSSHVFERSALRLAAGAGLPSFTYRNTDARLTSAPHLPALTLCPSSG